MTPDWIAFVRARLPPTGLTTEREARIVRELASQLDDFYRDARARGLALDAAERHAAAQITDWTTFAADVRRADPSHTAPVLDRVVNALERPESRSPGGLLMLAQVIRDVRYALRQLRRSPGFTTVALLTLALGIGATTAVFSVVDGVLLRPLPYAQADGLVRIHEVIPNIGLFSVAPANFFDWQHQNAVFDRLAAYSASSATFVGPDGPERVTGLQVSSDLLPVLGAVPELGRLITAEEDRPGGPKVIVLSHGLWQTRFNGDPKVVGTTITLNGVPTTVIGVMPAEFYFPSRAQAFWMPLALNPVNATRGGHFLAVIGRLKAGATADEAGINMRTVAESLARQYPKDSEGESSLVVPLQQQMVGTIRPALLVLFAAVGVVVLIVCANVANLLLVRAAVREKEMAIRASLGAGRRRLLVQVLAESVLLAALGGGLGVALGYLALDPIKTLSAGAVPRMSEVTLDGRVLAFATLASVVTGILFGLAPAWQASRASVSAVLKQSSRSSTSSGGWMRRGLLVAEMALSVVLLAGAVLVLRSFAKLVNVDPGFVPEHVLAFQVTLPSSTYHEDAKIKATFDGLLTGLASRPGVDSVAMVQTLPLRGDYNLSFSIRGVAPANGPGPSANYRATSGRYFETLSIPVLRGRPLGSQDAATSQRVAVVDDTFAKTYFPGADPIGQGLNIGNGSGDGAFTIVGVVGDVHYSGLDAVAKPTMYVPATQDPFSTMWVLVKAKGDPASLGGTARDVLRGIDPAVPAYSMTPLATVVSDSVAQRRFSFFLLAAFAMLALFLAAVGLYGVVAYSVGLRTPEIGLRLAIGAQPLAVLGMILWDGMKLALVGAAIGMVGAVFLSTFVKSMLFEVSPVDVESHAITAIALLIVAAVACVIPARRAMGVDPIVALQAE